MWWILCFVLTLVFFEQKRSLNSTTRYLAQIENNFWVVSNLIVLTMLLPYIVPFFLKVTDQLNLPNFLNLKDAHYFYQLLVLVLAMDFLKYVSHYFLHRFDFLWKIHSVHHSSKEITTLASFKHSWLESFYNVFLSCLFGHLIYVEGSVLVIVNSIFILICIWQHTNIDQLNIKHKVLAATFITPYSHRIHHEIPGATNHPNLGFIFTIWDRIFGTYSSSSSARPQNYGIVQSNYPHHSVIRQFFYPLGASKPTNVN